MPTARKPDSDRVSPRYQAIVDIAPLSLAVIPWGLLTGSLAIEAGLSPWQAQCMSLLVFAGAAQLASLNMVQIGSPLAAILSTTFVISSRHLLYSAVYRNFALQLKRHQRYLLAFVLTDEMFAVVEEYRKQHGRFHYPYAVTAGFTFWLVWNLASLAGIVLGQVLGDMQAWGFEFAVAAIFIAMVVPAVRSLAILVTVTASGVMMVIAELHSLPNGILIAGLVGMTAGFTTEQLQNLRQRASS
ncbi:AzlC family ABC transporter permease [Aestuariicella hydrocarbonica]|uniref:AzlC family ABC transporter permease n=1 Tax=Pseudomaricurvus hydrocarbonicus TaxID=1470433 RepID=A0A9E5ML26_9GAMM|nr:AzlC family ABC transporter permease [Aestuariicella hydrocarbonica]NHO66277.1 AzlC family ABC transporter permease [Aestuariicella hydrocarbonica]